MNFLGLALFALMQPVASAGQLPAQSPSQELRSLWLDWKSANADSLQAEARRTTTPSSRSADEARDLGARVGELVSTGDCEGGERMAREAGDLALVAAVRDHCRRDPSEYR